MFYEVLLKDKNNRVLEIVGFKNKQDAKKYIKQEVADCDGDLEGCHYVIAERIQITL